MLTAAKPEFLKAYWDNHLDLENHIQAFLNMDRQTFRFDFRKVIKLSPN